MWTILQSGDYIPSSVTEGLIVVITDVKGRKPFKKACKALAASSGVKMKVVYLIPIVGRIPLGMYPYLNDLYAE